MNIRLLNCIEGKQKHVSAIGQEGSFSDLKEKISKCLDSNIEALKNLEQSGYYKGKK